MDKKIAHLSFLLALVAGITLLTRCGHSVSEELSSDSPVPEVHIQCEGVSCF